MRLYYHVQQRENVKPMVKLSPYRIETGFLYRGRVRQLPDEDMKRESLVRFHIMIFSFPSGIALLSFSAKATWENTQDTIAYNKPYLPVFEYWP